jgi:hypothetical protein
MLSARCARTLVVNRLMRVPPAAHAEAAGITASIIVTMTSADPKATGSSRGRNALTAAKANTQPFGLRHWKMMA